MPSCPRHVRQRLCHVSMENCIMISFFPPLRSLEHVQPRSLQCGGLTLHKICALPFKNRNDDRMCPPPLASADSMRQRHVRYLRGAAGHFFRCELRQAFQAIGHHSQRLRRNTPRRRVDYCKNPVFLQLLYDGFVCRICSLTPFVLSVLCCSRSPRVDHDSRSYAIKNRERRSGPFRSREVTNDGLHCTRGHVCDMLKGVID
mmetsp:Transcript_36095/g.81253  ORF Transcript_36095/g.81253 Transcript_36095/m.81253 type:complete len:202 (+) Transcript_36095:1650-2255(+)